MSKFYQLLESVKPNKVKLVVEEFDPEKADAAGVKYTLTKVKDIDVVIKHKKQYVDAGVDEENTIIINQSDLTDANSSFCEYNPSIGQYAKESPENMFFVMGLVLASVQTSWVNFRNLYPVYAAYVKQTDGSDDPVDYIIGLDGKKSSVKKWFRTGFPKYLRSLWRNRNNLYKNIFEKDLISDSYELYRYILRHVEGMAVIKAAFAVQLLTGRLGCIDNINMDIYGMPVSIVSATGDINSLQYSKKNKVETDALTPKSKKIIGDYIDFLKAIGKVTNTDYSRRLWDDWVQLTAAKSVFAYSHKRIRFQTIDGRTAIIPTYSPSANTPEDTEYFKNLSKAGIDPYGGFLIGKEHFTLPKMAGEVDDATDRVKNL